MIVDVTHAKARYNQKSPREMLQERSKNLRKSIYKIEAKNSELKHRHGYDVASSSGLIGMEMQGAMALFTINVKRILKLMNEFKFTSVRTALHGTAKGRITIVYHL